jgi:hypothetical protein
VDSRTTAYATTSSPTPPSSTIPGASVERPSAVRCCTDARLSTMRFITIGTPRLATFAPIRQLSANATRHL